MNGSAAVKTAVQNVLTGEFTAIQAYSGIKAMLTNMGYHGLAGEVQGYIADEREHADKLMSRLLLLGGTPITARIAPFETGEDVPGFLANIAELERGASKDYRAAIVVCEEEHDFAARALLTDILEDEENDHLHAVESFIAQIEDMGIENFLSLMTAKKEGGG